LVNLEDFWNEENYEVEGKIIVNLSFQEVKNSLEDFVDAL